MILRHTGGGLSTAAGPISLKRARALAAHTRQALATMDRAIAEAEQWRRAAGWSDPELADRAEASAKT
jgi:hypothetical protein